MLGHSEYVSAVTEKRSGTSACPLVCTCAVHLEVTHGLDTDSVAPWFGGAWEALIKSAKRVMLGNVFTVDKVFLTVIAEVESLLNSCPLVYGGSSSSPRDVSALTPNHFLHGCASANLAPGEFDQRDKDR